MQPHAVCCELIGRSSTSVCEAAELAYGFSAAGNFVTSLSVGGMELRPAAEPSAIALREAGALVGMRRPLNRLLKPWVAEARLDPSDHSVESLRRTKALQILKGTGDLQTVRALLGHARIEITARYLGLKTNIDPIQVCRAFDI